MATCLDGGVVRQLIDAMRLLDHHDARQVGQRFVPWRLHGQRHGWLQRRYLTEHAELAACFTTRGAENELSLEMAPHALASGDLSRCLHQLFRQGVFIEWRDEAFPVRPVSDDFAAAPLQDLALERGCFRLLGLTSRAVHVNVWCGPENDRRVWVARRSLSKQVDPGKLDNTIAGGIAAGESVIEALCREAWEEAGLSLTASDVSHRAMLPVLSMRLLPEGLHREWLFIEDIEVDDAFRPQNQDGEVAGFALLDVPTLATSILAGQFTRDAALTLLCSMSAQGVFGAYKPLFDDWLAQREMLTLFSET
ncbi:NUDIX hydrolase [Leeia oryzae]|uniref:NUDIX hydrolase n=1 Tax=Leeia oryzae TaxID=356662 RepID=UPI0003661328|nr:DUF4743 domain-containing protein [Leeia oryzae]